MLPTSRLLGKTSTVSRCWESRQRACRCGPRPPPAVMTMRQRRAMDGLLLQRPPRGPLVGRRPGVIRVGRGRKAGYRKLLLLLHGGSSGSGGGRVRLPQQRACLGAFGGLPWVGRMVAAGSTPVSPPCAATLPIVAAWAPLPVASAEADNGGGVESSGAYPQVGAA